MRWVVPVLLALVAMLTAGCGGSGGSSPATASGTVGPFATRGNLSASPVTISSGSMQATAVTGTFSEVTLRDDKPNTATPAPR